MRGGKGVEEKRREMGGGRGVRGKTKKAETNREERGKENEKGLSDIHIYIVLTLIHLDPHSL